MCQLRWQRGIAVIWTLVALLGLAAPGITHAHHGPPPSAMPGPPPVPDPTSGDPVHGGGGGG